MRIWHRLSQIFSHLVVCSQICWCNGGSGTFCERRSWQFVGTVVRQEWQTERLLSCNFCSLKSFKLLALCQSFNASCAISNQELSCQCTCHLVSRTSAQVVWEFNLCRWPECRSVQELMFRANVKCQAANKLDAYMRRPRSSLLVSPEVSGTCSITSHPLQVFDGRLVHS